MMMMMMMMMMSCQPIRIKISQCTCLWLPLYSCRLYRYRCF